MDPQHDEPTEDEWATMTMTELIARSSFGTRQAVALRAESPSRVVHEIMAFWRAEQRSLVASVHDVNDLEVEQRLAMSTAGLPPKVFRALYCGCSPVRCAANDAIVQAVADELCDGDRHRVVTAVVVGLQNYEAEIIGIPTDMWSAVIAETYDRRFQTRIECDYIEHGFAGTWLAFKERFPGGTYTCVDDDPDDDDGLDN